MRSSMITAGKKIQRKVIELNTNFALPVSETRVIAGYTLLIDILTNIVR